MKPVINLVPIDELDRAIVTLASRINAETYELLVLIRQFDERALKARDKTCTFPGCHHQQFVDAHHNQHWSAGGETSLDNLVLLCSQHHKLVHEGGFTIERDY
jgi:predicted restriction endonuclease